MGFTMRSPDETLASAHSAHIQGEWMNATRRIQVGILLVGAAFASRGEDGIHVAPPKVYDDVYLQSQLNTLKNRLGALMGFDAAALTAKIGSTQGGRLEQSGFSFNVLGPSAPQVATTVASGGPAGTTSETVTTRAAQAPSVPGAPSLGMALPAAFSVSALDTLSEMTQLNYQILNLQLLLEGALSDQFQLRGGAKKRLTLGFPIALERSDFRHDGKIAEVEITVCNNPLAKAGDEPPSVVNILPLENTYNTVSVTDNVSSIGIGAIAGAFSIGGNFLSGDKTYYLVKQQDTRALLRAPRMDVPCGLRLLDKDEQEAMEKVAAHARPKVIEIAGSDRDAELGSQSEPLEAVLKVGGALKRRVPRTTFAWQFLPALGQPFVKPGIRHAFVQLAVPDPKPSRCSGSVFVQTAWKKHPRKRYLFESPEPPQGPPVEAAQVFEYDTKPYSFDVSVQDLGSGSVLVQANGAFLEGLRVRIGSSLMDPSAPGFVSTRKGVQFVAPAQALVLGDVFLVGSDGVAHPLQFYPKEVSPYGLASCTVHEGERESAPPQLIRIEGAIDVASVSETHSRVTIRLGTIPDQERQRLADEGKYLVKHEARFPLVAMVGGRVYGLLDAPFEKKQGNEIRIIAPSDSLRASPSVRVQRLMMGQAYSTRDWVMLDPPHGLKATLVAAGPPVVVSLSGRHVRDLCLVSPAPPFACGVHAATARPLVPPSDGAAPAPPQHPSLQLVTDTFGLVTLPTETAASAKQLIFKRSTSDARRPHEIVTINLPTEAKPPPPSTGPKLGEVVGAVTPGASRVTITGTNLDQIAGIRFMDQWLNFVIAPNSKSLTLDLPAAATAGEGIRYLEVIAADRSSSRYKLEVKKA
jgi:hypothetical protein